jgi:cobalt-zinc-cadmium efflux system protein
VHAHTHTHTHAPPLTGDRGRWALAIALGLNAAYTAIEAVAGVLTDSLALLADAAHNLSDVLALAVALVAALLARRPPTATRSFGYMRAEILSALFNGVLVAVVAVWIAVAAVQRLDDPPAIAGGWLVAVAAAGIAVNALAAAILLRSARDNLNVRASVVHLGADALASAGVVVAGLVIVVTGWEVVDPVAAILIACLILLGSWGVIRDAVHVLLEGVPRGIDSAAVGSRLAAEPGVRDVHDLHIWEITSGFPALSAHVLVDPDGDCHGMRRHLERILADEFHIEHTTLQVDHAQPELVQIRR